MSRFLGERMQHFRAYVPGEQPRNMHKLIKLNTNESPYPPSPRVVQTLTNTSIERLRLYSDLAASDLTKALCEDLGVEPEQIITGNGSDEVIYFAMLAFGDRGVQFADITYGFYTVWAKLIGQHERVTPLLDDFSINPDDYMNNDRMVIIANPNAPTGVAMSLDQIERILQANPDQIVLIDEAYVDFGGQSAVALVDKYENLIVCRTFSKSRQMAGARLGFAVGSKEVIEDMNKMRFSINPYNVNSLTQALGAEAVRDKDYFNWACERIINTRERTARELSNLGFTVLPSCANFLFAKPNFMSGHDYMQALREKKILVRWFDQDRIRDFLRITIGTDDQMERLIDVTRQLMEILQFVI